MGFKKELFKGDSVFFQEFQNNVDTDTDYFYQNWKLNQFRINSA